jgi:hypothetical protein
MCACIHNKGFWFVDFKVYIQKGSVWGRREESVSRERRKGEGTRR